MGDVIDFLVRKKTELTGPGGLLEYLENNPDFRIITKGKNTPEQANEISKDIVRRYADLIDKQALRYQTEKDKDGYEQAFTLINEWRDLYGNYKVKAMTAADKAFGDDPDLVEEYKLQFDSLKAITNLVIHEPKSAPDSYKAAPKELADLFAQLNDKSIEELLALQKERTEVIGAMVQLLLKIDTCYSELKAGVRGMDFSDQEYAAYDILETMEFTSDTDGRAWHVGARATFWLLNL